MSEVVPARDLEVHTLQWLKHAVHLPIPKELVTEVNVVQDYVSDQYLTRIRTDILAKRLPDRSYRREAEISVEIPTSWWQMFKETHSGTWWLRRLVDRRPVQYRYRRRYATLTVDLEDYLVYPWQTEVTPGLGPVVRVPVLNDRVTYTGDIT